MPLYSKGFYMLRSGNVSGKEAENAVAMDVQLASIICPITNEIFFEPKMAVPCGHTFEYDSIKKWKAAKNSCPCCRKKIEKLIDAPPLLIEMLENILAKYPHLQNQRYFSLDILHRAVTAKDSNKLDKIIVFLLLMEDRINFIEKNGDSVLRGLSKNSVGAAALERHDKLRAKLNVDSLNNSSNVEGHEGTTTLAWLVCYNAGLESLIKDEVFRAKITPYGLNNIITGSVDRGTSALYWLLISKAGVQMLCWDKELCAKVTEEGLNSIQLEKRPNADRNTGLSALFYLIFNEEGLELLREDTVLRGKITAKGINAVCRDTNLQGQSPVYVLVQSQRGRDLLNMDEDLRKLIKIKTLYTKVIGSDKSAADCLRETLDGIELLKKLDPHCNERSVQQHANIHGLFHEQPVQHPQPQPQKKNRKSSRCNIM